MLEPILSRQVAVLSLVFAGLISPAPARAQQEPLRELLDAVRDYAGT